MKTEIILLLLQCSYLFVLADLETRDLELDIDNEDLGRKHKKKRKKQQQFGPCGYGRSLEDGRSFGFGEKLFGLGQQQHDYYINAPVNNYYFGCGVQNPVQSGGHGGQGGHGGHGGHGNHGGHGSHGGLGGHGGQGGHGGHGGHGGLSGIGGQQSGFNPQQSYGNPYPQNNVFQGAFSAAASSFGTALADYIAKPKKAQRQINRLLRPIYRLF